MRNYRAEGVCLLVRRYRGTGRVATFFTRERGKVEAVAQGVGKPGSTLAPAVELFAQSVLFFAQGRNLDRLTQARVIEEFEPLRRNALALGYAGFVAELLARATESGEPMPDTYSDLVAALSLLSAGAEPMPVAAATTWRLLLALGVAPELARCTRCGEPIKSRSLFVAGEGGVVCRSCFAETDADAETSHPVQPPTRGLAGTLGRLSIDRVPRLQLDMSVWSDLLRIERLQIRHYLSLELNSDAFLRQVGGG